MATLFDVIDASWSCRMLCLAVTPQIYLALERPRADAAGEWLEAGEFTTVSDEVRRLAKGLATLATHVRLLTCNILSTC